jgi:hypothetical protein
MMTSGDACPTNGGSLKVATFCWFNRPRLNRNVSVQAASPEPAEKKEVVNLANENLNTFIIRYKECSKMLYGLDQSLSRTQ